MKTKGQYLLMNPAEFAEWLAGHEFDRTVTRIQNHHTWKPTYASFDGGNYFAMLDGMYDYHVHSNGWNNIGQNLTTFPDGLIAVCRPFESTPACIYGANKGAICIEHIGNFDTGQDRMAAAHAHAIVRLNALLCHEFGLTPDTDSIVYHHWYDLDTGRRNDGAGNNKSCPGTAFFGGNKVPDCRAHFIPKVLADLAVVSRGGRQSAAVALRKARVASPDGVLTVRNAPSGSGKRLGELTNGKEVEVFENDGRWCRIAPKASRWVHGGYLVATAVESAQPVVHHPRASKAARLFKLRKPKPAELGDELELWGTYYYGQAAKPVTGGIPLRNMSGATVGPAISQRDWCLAAMEGTLVVSNPDGTLETFNYEGKGDSAETSCAVFFPNLNPAIRSGTERVRWRRAKGPYGDGAGGFILAPYRSWAVDKSEIPLGTVLYVAEARGTPLTLPDGTAAKHDGYFFAADVGGAIKDNHVDFFLGITADNPFPFVRSKPQGTFTAAIVKSKKTSDYLHALHTA